MNRLFPLAMPLALSLVCTACSPEGADEFLRPSLTMVRIGEVVVEEPPPVPEDNYVPGIQFKSEDYDIDETGRGIAPPPFSGDPTDMSRMADHENPAPLDKHSTYAYNAGVGALFEGDASEDDLQFDDVEQGAIGDCYAVAALSAVLYADSDHSVRDGLIREQVDNDGYVTGYSVRLYDAWGVPQDVTVSADLVRKNDRPTYARSMDTDLHGEEFGISLVEKAYAKWHGGYTKIGDGGWSGDVMQALTGSTANYRTIAHMSDKTIVRSISDAVGDNRPVVAGTFGEEDDVDYTGTKIYAWHAYTVLDITVPDEGEPKVKLRNPWGEVEPADNGPDDGIFEIELPEFRRLYQGLTFGGSYSVDTSAPGAVDDLELGASAGGRATLSFSATGDDGSKGLAHKYDVRVFDEAPNVSSFYDGVAVEVGTPQAPDSAETLTVDLPDPSKTWYVVVRVEDEAGNISPLSNIVTISAADKPIDGVLPTLFDFESNTDDWKTEGTFHLSDVYAASGSYAFYMGDDDTLEFGNGGRVQASLTSPVIDLRQSSTAVLLWEHLLDVEASSSKDQAVLEVATQRGGFDDWTTVWQKDALSDDFSMQQVDLDGFIGTQVQLRFRFDSVDEKGNNGLGWIVDDVWVWAD